MSCREPQNKHFPSAVNAGLTFEHFVTLAEYPAPEWALVVLIRGKQSIDLQGVQDGTGFAFSADAQTTTAWAPGVYQYSLRATRGTEVRQVETGTIEVKPDLALTPAGSDGRSQAAIALEAIDAVLSKRATLDQERYRINNRELYRTPIADLIKLRTFYLVQVQRENARRTGKTGFGRAIHVRFS